MSAGFENATTKLVEVNGTPFIFWEMGEKKGRSSRHISS
jgi:hypothetical protein